MLLYFSWLFAIWGGIAIIQGNVASVRRLRLDRSLMDADQPPTHTYQHSERFLAGRTRKPPLLNAAVLVAVLGAASVALALLLVRSDVLLALSLTSGAMVAAVAGSFAAKRSALNRFKVANESFGSRKIASIRQRQAEFEASLSKTNADRNERETLEARLASMRRDGLVGAARLRDGFDL